MQNWRAPGDVITLANGPAAVPSGTCFPWGGDRFGIAVVDCEADQPACSVAVSGVFEMTASGSVTIGSMVEGTTGTDSVVNLSTGIPLGRALASATSGQKVLVRLEDIGAS